MKDTSSIDMTIEYLKKATKIFEEDDEIIFYLADLYRRKHDLKEALTRYSEAIKYSKTNGEDFYLVYSYYFNRGNCQMQLGSYDSALYDYNYTLKLKADYTFALINRGACYLYKEDIEDACQDWQRAYDLGNKNSLPYLNKYCKWEP